MFVALAIALCATSEIAQAAQVTFAFDATVTDIADPDGIAALLPFQPALGQLITGSVAFTPVPFAQSSDEDAHLEIVFEGEMFTASALKLATNNDVYIAVGFEVQGPFDSLSVSCGTNNECPNTSSSTDGVDVTFLGIGLSGGDLIPSSTLIDSPALWNLFPSRRLVLSLSDGNGGAPLTIGADFGPVSAIPEPSSLFSVLTILATLALFCFRRSSIMSRHRRDIPKFGCFVPRTRF